MYVNKRVNGRSAWTALLAMLLLLVQGCAVHEQAAQPAAPGATVNLDVPPPAPREFRAAWVSTVANIDWPSRSNLPVAKQQAEAIAILDRAKSLNLNAIVLQVRPSADTIYPSQLEPWSEYLTGQQGQPPLPASSAAVSAPAPAPGASIGYG